MIQIIPFSEKLRSHIKTLNYEWLENYFQVEPNDVIQLNDPENEIIAKGGLIFYATWNDSVVGTYTLLRIDETTSELGKMAVSGKVRGLGVGNALMQHCMDTAKALGVQKLILFSNTRLEPAIHLYRKYGFTETEFEKGHYKRSDIKMEKLL